MVTAGGEENTIASYFWTLGTFGAGSIGLSPNGPQNFDQGQTQPSFNIEGTDGYTDLAFAKRYFWNPAGQTAGGIAFAQEGVKAYLSRNDMVFHFRNNMNVRAFVTVTYFSPRSGVNLAQSYYNGEHMLEGLKSQSNVVYSPSFDWRNVANVNSLFKMVVKKWTLPPGGTKGLKFKCGGIPFFGNNNRFDEARFSSKFTRFMHIMAWGDVVLSQVGLGMDQRPVYASQNVYYGPVNLTYTCTHRIEGKVIAVPNAFINNDLTTEGNAGTAPTPYSWSNGVITAGPKVVPIGGDVPQFIQPETSGFPK